MKARLIEELANAATQAVSMALGARDEMKGIIKSRLEEVIGRLDLVTREEFNVVKAMAEEARLEQQRLRKEMDVLKKSHKKPAKAKVKK